MSYTLVDLFGEGYTKFYFEEKDLPWGWEVVDVDCLSPGPDWEIMQYIVYNGGDFYSITQTYDMCENEGDGPPSIKKVIPKEKISFVFEEIEDDH